MDLTNPNLIGAEKGKHRVREDSCGECHPHQEGGPKHPALLCQNGRCGEQAGHGMQDLADLSVDQVDSTEASERSQVHGEDVNLRVNGKFRKGLRRPRCEDSRHLWLFRVSNWVISLAGRNQCTIAADDGRAGSRGR